MPDPVLEFWCWLWLCLRSVNAFWRTISGIVYSWKCCWTTTDRRTVEPYPEARSFISQRQPDLARRHGGSLLKTSPLIRSLRRSSSHMIILSAFYSYLITLWGQANISKPSFPRKTRDQDHSQLHAWIQNTCSRQQLEQAKSHCRLSAGVLTRCPHRVCMAW